MQNLNPYNEEEFKKEFINSSVYKSLVERLPRTKLTWNKQFDDTYTARDVCKKFKRVSLAIFYYLNFILEKEPNVIYDLGCGQNFFKRFVTDKIVGIDPCTDDMIPQCSEYVDRIGFVDDEFVQEHKECFKYVFSINALHFIRVEEFRKRVEDFASMIAPGGIGVLTMNANCLYECDPASEDYIRKELDMISNINFLVVDIDFTVFNEPSDGNIRLVIQK